jgi:predicted ATPase
MVVAEHTSFVGRIGPLSAVGRLLDRGRAVALVGPAGIGKTRAAKEVARERSHQHDAIVFVDLSCAIDRDDVLRAVAIALDVPPSRESTAEESDEVSVVGARLDALGRALLILDAADHLGPAVRELFGAWSSAAERACFLVTSREPTGIEGEHVYALDPLRLGEAMALYESRARMDRHDFAVCAANRAAIAEIVQTVGRLPLAIELVAARIGKGTPLSGHAELADVIDWTWKLLQPWEQSALLQCSTFRGGFDLILAESIVDLSEHPAAPCLADVLRSLCSLRLLRTFSPISFPNEVRFDLSESVRAFAWERMLDSCASDHLAKRRSEGRMLDEVGHLHRREACFIEAKAAYRQALILHREACDRRAEALVLGSLGALSIEEENSDAARTCLVSAIALAKEIGCARTAAVDRMRLAIVDHLEGALDRANRGVLRAIAELDAIGDRRHSALARAHLGAILAEAGALTEAERELDAARTTLLALSEVELTAAVEVLSTSLDVARLSFGPLDRLLEVERTVPAPEARIAELVIKRSLGRARRRIDALRRRQSRIPLRKPGIQEGI